MKWRDFLASYS